MKHQLATVLVILISSGAVTCESFSFFRLKSMIGFGRKLYDVVKRGIESDDVIQTIVDGAAEVVSDLEANDDFEKIKSQLKFIAGQLNYAIARMEAKFGVIEKAIGQVSSNVEVDGIKRDIANAVRRVKNLYDDVVLHSNNLDKYNKAELENLADKLIGTGSENLRDSLLKVYNYVAPEIAEGVKPSFLQLLDENTKAKKLELCGQESYSQYLNNLYTVIVVAEMMGLVSLSFGYQLQRRIHDVSVDFELRQAAIEREKRLTRYFGAFKRAMEGASLDFRSCDAPQNVRGETYVELEGLYQAILVREYGLNEEDSCRGTCSTVDRTSYQNDGVTCGRMYNCWSMKSTRYCKLPGGQPKRYQWIEDINGGVYGDKQGCQGEEIKTYVTLLGFFHVCEYCLCTCEGNSVDSMLSHEAFSTHVVSLLPSRSDVNNNMVITGVRFAARDGIVHIQVKQGKLQAEGQIAPGTETWSVLPDMRAEVLNTRIGRSSPYENGRDFVVIDQYHNAVNLDDLVVPSGRVVTGVKFGLSKENGVDGSWRRIEVQVEHMEFNFTSGQLKNSLSVQPETASSSKRHDVAIRMTDRDSPLKSPDQNIPVEIPNSYVKFGYSSFDRDAGQTTIPFLDTRSVDSKLGAPLTGVGLFLKASEGFGGFLSFRLFSLNFSEYMEKGEQLSEFYDVPGESGKAPATSRTTFELKPLESYDDYEEYDKFDVFFDDFLDHLDGTTASSTAREEKWQREKALAESVVGVHSGASRLRAVFLIISVTTVKTFNFQYFP